MTHIFNERRFEELAGFPRQHTAADILLLEAAILTRPAGLSAYRQFLEQFDFGEISPQWQRLLPWLHENLSQQGFSDSLTERFHGIRRYVWVRNLKLAQFAKRVFDVLQDAEIPYLVLKGGAIIGCYLKDRSLRPMDDIDILVREEQLHDVALALARIDVRPQFTTAARLIGNVSLRASLPGWPFIGNEQNVDVHWKVLHLDRGPEADDRFWSRAQRVSLDGSEIAVLSAGDQLLHVIAHAAQSSPPLPLQWALDSTIILRGSQPIAWELFIEEAQRHQLSAVAADALRFLAGTLGLPVPADVVTRLHYASSLTERIEARLLGSASRTAQTPIAAATLDFQNFRRGPVGLLSRPAVSAIGPFVRERTGSSSVPRALLAFLFKSLDRPPWLRGFARRDRDLSLPERDALPAPGGILDLSVDGCGEEPLFRGWSIGEPGGRWTVGPETSIAWRIDRADTDWALSIDAEPFIVPEAGQQQVDLWINDRHIDRWQFEWGNPTAIPSPIKVPQACTTGRDLLVLTFSLRRYRSPAELGLNEDRRRLGLFVRTIALRPWEPSKDGGT